MKYATIGILAHVDAGKTTLSESLMYAVGKLKSIGRVDKKDSFLDTDPIERERGITIFSKQAILDFGDLCVTLLDTPGHADFVAETERTLSVLDAAILVISGPQMVESHTRTLWQLLRTMNIPTFIFVNKMDLEGADKDKVLASLKKELSYECVDFTEVFDMPDEFSEEIATCDEELLESFLNCGTILFDDIRKLFKDSRIFPVMFGSALKFEGVRELRDVIAKTVIPYEGNEEFGARIYKISRDGKEERLTNMKITGGCLNVRDTILNEKVTAIKIYDGVKYTAVSSANCGQIVAVSGLSETYSGQGIGMEEGKASKGITPVLSYSLILPKDINESDAISKLLMLSEEQPDLSIEYNPETHSISISLMGEVQTEVIKRRIFERFSFNVEFGEKRIIYRETIKNTVEGVGHFEPLRHYAEVHLLLEPLEEGEGLVFETDLSEDILDKNWQRLIVTHLKERVHKGVLTGSPITDMKITLVGGKAHIKHTEGGDFRQATYRAVRNGLMQAQSRLLEPYYNFELEIPSKYIGRAMTDLERMHAKAFSPETYGEKAILRGSAPVSTLTGYSSDVISYTAGLGKLSVSLRGYSECHNTEEVIEKIGYDAERDVKNTADSVFCSHGAGVIIPWNDVKQHMHMPSYLNPTKKLTDEQIRMRLKREAKESTTGFLSNEEVDAIIKSSSFANKKETFIPHKGINHKMHVRAGETKPPVNKGSEKQSIKEEYILVDGYNVIYTWENLKALAKENIDSARDALIDILSDYSAMKGTKLIAVFDAYRLRDHKEECIEYHNINVVYTKSAQTADYYIERFAKENKNKYRIRVVTSDNIEQVIVSSDNAFITSSREFYDEVKNVKEEFNKRHGIT